MSEKLMEAVNSTYRKLLSARQQLLDFVRDNPDLFNRFAALVDEFNQARATHVGALKVAKVASPLFRMGTPKSFVCPDLDMARKFLKDRFDEFVEMEPKVKTAAIRNVIEAGTLPGIEMVFTEIEDTPRHTGPKVIDISSLRD